MPRFSGLKKPLCSLLLAAGLFLPQTGLGQSAPPPPLKVPDGEPAETAPAESGKPAIPAPPATPLQERLEQVYFDENHRLNNKQVYAAGQLMDLYKLNGFQPLWQEREWAVALRTAVLASLDDGLVPADYHLDIIKAALGEEDVAPQGAAAELRKDEQTADTPESTPTAPYAPTLEQDILLSDSFLLLGEHLLHGKVDGRDVAEKKGLTKEAPAVDVDSYFQALSQGKITEALQERTPHNRHYQALKNALVQYNQSQDAGFTHVPEGPSIRPGMRGSRVRDLKKRLAESGELTATETVDDLYDKPLVEAVRKFQAAQGLKADGTAGKLTIQALNGKMSKAKVQQIRANLERTRWLMHDQPDTAVLVDIAGYRLYFYQGGKPVWDTRVMVGKPYNQTPSFRSAINYLVVNPTWTVPPGMLRKEYVPKILQNPEYLASTGLKVYDSKGNQVSPAGVNWSRCAKRDCPYILRQDPGVGNSLGRMKFMFPNPYHVYLHDTPSKGLFGRKSRALSHGCIRVDKPRELAHRLLEAVADQENAVSVKYFDKILDSGKNAGFRLAEPIPVFLFYATVKADAEGRLGFTADIYGRDAAVIKALDQPPRPLSQKPLITPKETEAAQMKAEKAEAAEPATAQEAPQDTPDAPRPAEKTGEGPAAPIR